MRGVDRAQDARQRRTLVRNAQPRSRRLDPRRLVAQRLEQPRHPGAARRRTKEQRDDQSLSQLRGEIVEHLVARRLDVGDQLLHQRVVVIGEALQHRVALLLLLRRIARGDRDDLGGRVLAIDIGALKRQIDETDGDAILPDRHLPRQQGRARRRL